MDEAVRERIHLMWDRVIDLGAANINTALEFMLTELTEMLDAHYTWWLGTLRLSDIASNDPIFGWRPRAVYNLHQRPERVWVKKEHIRRIESGEIDQSVVANMRGVGSYRVNIMHEILPPEWFQSYYYENFYKPFEMRDGIYVAVPLGENVESWFAFERNGFDKPLYGDEERELLDYAIRPMKWFHHQLVLSYGVHLAEEPLTDSERRILTDWITDKTEQEIAKEHGLSPSTVHTYGVSIARKFGVRGRTGLKALWLGKGLQE